MRHANSRPARRSAGNPSLAIAYLRVSTEDQNLGPEAQRAAIERWAAGRGVTVLAWHEDRLSGATTVEGRAGMLAALASLREHGAGLLLAAKRDRIARDVVVAATVERLVQDAGAVVVTADGVSIENTPEGALMRGLMDLFAQYERSVIRARTTAALAAKRARVRELRLRGLSLERVAGILNAEGQTLRGGRFHVTTLARALARASSPAAA